jgi:hypothetical protein
MAFPQRREIDAVLVIAITDTHQAYKSCSV